VQSDLDEVKRRLREIFNYYSSFGDRLNTSNLKSSKFHKMMQDALIITESSGLMEKKRLDLIFCQVNKHKSHMSFESFLQTLTKLADYKYPHEGGQGLAL